MLNTGDPLQNLYASFGNERSRIDYRIIKNLNNKYSIFLYNSLYYKFFPESNIYVNQYGYGMPYEMAIKLAQDMGYLESDLINTQLTNEEIKEQS